MWCKFNQLYKCGVPKVETTCKVKMVNFEWGSTELCMVWKIPLFIRCGVPASWATWHTTMCLDNACKYTILLLQSNVVFEIILLAYTFHNNYRPLSYLAVTLHLTPSNYKVFHCSGTITNQRGVVPNLLASIHPVYSGVNTRERNGYHNLVISNFSRESKCLLVLSVTLHLGGTVC